MEQTKKLSYDIVVKCPGYSHFEIVDTIKTTYKVLQSIISQYRSNYGQDWIVKARLTN